MLLITIWDSLRTVSPLTCILMNNGINLIPRAEQIGGAKAPVNAGHVIEKYSQIVGVFLNTLKLPRGK